MNRLLIISAMRGDDLALLPIDESMPEDVRLLHEILLASQVLSDAGNNRQSTFNCRNCGTAMRFLTAYYAQKAGVDVVLDGSERMRHRPIGQLVNALRSIGAEIEYLGEEGYPPVRIQGRLLENRKIRIDNPQSTQFVSALLLIGKDVETNISSPYIDMTRTLLTTHNSLPTTHYSKLSTTLNSKLSTLNSEIELCWSCAAFWYEYVSLHGGEVFFPHLTESRLQGDMMVAEIYKSLGVETMFLSDGVLISQVADCRLPQVLEFDFSRFPDLYPPVYATCIRLGIEMRFSGLESLPLKESDRFAAMQQLSTINYQLSTTLNTKHSTLNSYRSHSDHRIAMALLCADCEVDDTDCISKSYPQFMQQWRRLQ